MTVGHAPREEQRTSSIMSGTILASPRAGAFQLWLGASLCMGCVDVELELVVGHACQRTERATDLGLQVTEKQVRPHLRLGGRVLPANFTRQHGNLGAEEEDQSETCQPQILHTIQTDGSDSS